MWYSLQYLNPLLNNISVPVKILFLSIWCNCNGLDIKWCIRKRQKKELSRHGAEQAQHDIEAYNERRKGLISLCRMPPNELVAKFARVLCTTLLYYVEY